MSLSAALASVVSLFLASGTVSLATIHAQPGAYENKVVKTCGDYYGGDELFLRNWILGRSRGAMHLTDTMKQEGYLCIRAQVVRSMKPRPKPTGLVIVDHPTVVPDEWQLRVIRILSRKDH